MVLGSCKLPPGLTVVPGLFVHCDGGSELFFFLFPHIPCSHIFSRVPPLKALDSFRYMCDVDFFPFFLSLLLSDVKDVGYVIVRFLLAFIIFFN